MTPQAFGITPPEPAQITNLSDCNPVLAARLSATFDAMEARGHRRPVVRESLRTAERQTWLWGIGRDYDPDGRGIVTHAQTAEHGWHIYGCAADCIDPVWKDNAPAIWYKDLAECAEANGLASGYRWPEPKQDSDHLQLAECPVSPTNDFIVLRQSQGNAAVWAKLNAA